MKKTILLLFTVLFVLSCSTDGYKIKGTFDAAPDGTVIYMIDQNDELAVVDSAIVSGGKFEFSGGYYERSVRMLLAQSEYIGGPVVLEPGVINVKFGENVERGGTHGNEILQRFVAASEHLRNLEHITSPAFIKSMPMDKAMFDSLVDVRDKAKTNLLEYSLLAIEQNVDNGLGFYILSQMYQNIDSPLLANILSRVPLYLQSSRFNVIKNHATHRLMADRQKIATAVGRPYQNFELPDLSGKNVLFSDIVAANNYTLLQFWASWCAPCRAELPLIEKLHSNYKRGGFSVVGLSLDSDIEECRSAVSKLGLSFVQLCKPTGGSGEVATAYGVDEIPANVLINNKGTILARNLSPAEIEKLLAEGLR